VLEKNNEAFDYIYIWSTEEEKKQRKKEYLEEKQNYKKRKNTSKSVSYLPTKIENNTSVKNDYNEKKRKEKRENTQGNKYTEEEKNVENRNGENKINYKFATKESSLEDVKGNKIQKMFNSPEAENNRKNSRTRTHNIKRKNSRVENEVKKENEEICCTEACYIF